MWFPLIICPHVLSPQTHMPFHSIQKPALCRACRLAPSPKRVRWAGTILDMDRGQACPAVIPVSGGVRHMLIFLMLSSLHHDAPWTMTPAAQRGSDGRALWLDSSRSDRDGLQLSTASRAQREIRHGYKCRACYSSRPQSSGALLSCQPPPDALTPLASALGTSLGYSSAHQYRTTVGIIVDMGNFQ